MCTRLATNVSNSYFPMYLMDALEFEKVREREGERGREGGREGEREREREREREVKEREL